MEVNELLHGKTCLRGLRPGMMTLAGLTSCKESVEPSNFRHTKLSKQQITKALIRLHSHPYCSHET